MWIFGYDAIWGYEELFYTAFGGLHWDWRNFPRAMVPLVLIGLGFAVASRAGFFNVGLPGQALCRLDSLAVGLPCQIPDMPRLVLIPLTVIVALIAGGIGAIPGILSAYLGTSEVIVTIMMNYIVLYVEMPLFMPFPKDIMQVQTQRFVLVPMHTRHHGCQS